MKTLIVTADDFGLSFGTVSGIVEAFKRGIVTSTSGMVQAPAWSQAVEAAKENPFLQVGVHFVLTAGRPVGDAAGLSAIINKEGRFHRRDDGGHDQLSADGVAAELDAQIRLLRDALGKRPTHIDSHHHVHEEPAVLRGVIEMARELGVPVRAPTDEVTQALEDAGVATTGRFIGDFYDGDEGHGVSVESLQQILLELEDGPSELMCHPAHIDPLLERISGYARPRVRELATLISPEISEVIEGAGIRLVGPSER